MSADLLRRAADVLDADPGRHFSRAYGEAVAAWLRAEADLNAVYDEATGTPAAYSIYDETLAVANAILRETA